MFPLNLSVPWCRDVGYLLLVPRDAERHQPLEWLHLIVVQIPNGPGNRGQALRSIVLLHVFICWFYLYAVAYILSIFFLLGTNVLCLYKYVCIYFMQGVFIKMVLLLKTFFF